MPRTSALRRDVPWQAVPHPGQRVRHPSNGTRQAAADPVDGGSSRLGTPVHRRDQGRAQSSPAISSHDAGRQRTARRLGVPRRLHGALRQTGRPPQHRGGSEPRWRAQRAPRRTAAAGARRPGRDQPVQDRLGVRRGRGDRDDAPRPRNAAGGHELGHGADTAAVQPFAVSPVRRPLEQEGGDRPRPPADQGRGETAARYRAAAR